MKCKGKNIAKVGNIIVKTNIYRCTEYCPNCPFLDDGKAVGLKKGGVNSIKSRLKQSDEESFTCHKTAYNLNNEMDSSEYQAPKMCYGAFKYLQEIKRPNIMMRLALSRGIDK